MTAVVSLINLVLSLSDPGMLQDLLQSDSVHWILLEQLGQEVPGHWGHVDTWGGKRRSTFMILLYMSGLLGASNGERSADLKVVKESNC